MIIKADIEQFRALARECPVLDVRSPGEYGHAHIPGAYSLPLFTDEERKVVGTAYKQQGRKPAIKIGLDLFGPKMRKMVDEVEALATGTNNNSVLVHCWRGGMRSAGVAWLLDIYGFKVYTLQGGYKAFRNWALQQFSRQYQLQVLGGYTGSGKTQVLHQLAAGGNAIIDLEDIAKHKGSAFGGLGQDKQPTQEMFENILALRLSGIDPNVPAWIEDESRRIGDRNIPNALWAAMRQAPLYFMDMPFEERLDNILAGYGGFNKDELAASVIRIQKRLGGLETKNALTHLAEENYKECFRILLRYYDKCYKRGLEDSNSQQDILNIACATVDATANSQQLLSAFESRATH